MDRRHFLQLAGATALSSQLPFAWADNTQPLSIYGPTALPTVLLGVAAEQQHLQQSLIKQSFEVKRWRTPDMLRAGLANGTIQASFIPTYVGANLANRGMDVHLLNIMTWGLVDIVGSVNSANKLEDLVGRSVAVPLRNDMPDLVLQTLCQLQGVDYKKINIQYTPTPAEAMSYWLDERVDFAVLNEPIASVALLRAQSLRNKKAERVISLSKLWQELHNHHSKGIPQVGLLVTSKFYEEHNSFLQQLQQELSRVLTWTHAYPNNAAKIGNSLLELPAEAIAASIPHANLAADAAIDVKEDIDLFFNALYELNPKILGGSLPKDNFIISF